MPAPLTTQWPGWPSFAAPRGASRAPRGGRTARPKYASTNRPPRISPRDSIRRSVTNRSRHGGASGLPASGVAENHSPARQQAGARRLPRCRRAVRRCGAAVPIVPVRGGDAWRERCLSRAAFGIEQGAQIFEPVGRHQTRGHQFPEPVLHFTRQPAGSARQIGEERRPVRFDCRQHLARRMRERIVGRRLRCREQPRRILAQEDGERRYARRTHAAAAIFFGSRSKAGCGESRPQLTSPERHSCVEIFRTVVRDAGAAESPPPMPTRRIRSPAAAGRSAACHRRRATGCRAPGAASDAGTRRTPRWSRARSRAASARW